MHLPRFDPNRFLAKQFQTAFVFGAVHDEAE
jgi:hypothetical protein